MAKGYVKVFDDPIILVVQELAYEGFTHKTISRSLRRLTTGQVSYRLDRLGVSTAEVRRGESEEGKARLQRVLGKHKKRLSK